MSLAAGCVSEELKNVSHIMRRQRLRFVPLILIGLCVPLDLINANDDDAK